MTVYTVIQRTLINQEKNDLMIVQFAEVSNDEKKSIVNGSQFNINFTKKSEFESFVVGEKYLLAKQK